MEPPAVLVRAFQVQIGGPPALTARLQNRRVADAGLEPDIQDVLFFLKGVPSAFPADRARRHQILRRLLKPHVGATLGDEVSHMVDYLGVREHLSACRADEGRDRCPPHPLSGQAPVRAVLDHSVDPVAPSGRDPCNPTDFRERLSAQPLLVHRDKPLFGGPEDHGTFAPPAVRIGVGEGTVPQQQSVGP